MVVTSPVSHLGVASVRAMLKTAAPLNMLAMLVTFFVSQFLMVSWSALLNFAAPSNMPSIDVTAEVSHVSSLLNADAPLNMFFMFVTADVTQVLMSWSNNMAPWNMPSMSVTAVIFHFVPSVGMSRLKATAPLNMFFVLVTADVTQVLMVSLTSLSNALAPWNMPSMVVA